MLKILLKPENLKSNLNFNTSWIKHYHYHLNAFGEQNVSRMRVLFKSCRQNSSVPRTLKKIEFFWALIRRNFYQILTASDELFNFKSPSFSCASLDCQLNSWNWRNSRLKERLHRTQTLLTFLTVFLALCSFKLILPNNGSDRSFLKAIDSSV